MLILITHCQYIEIQLLFVCCLQHCILIFIWLVLVGFFFLYCVGFSTQMIMISACKNSLLSSFQPGCLYYYWFYLFFSCLIILVRISSTISIKSSDSSRPGLFLILVGEAFSLPPLNMILAVFPRYPLQAEVVLFLICKVFVCCYRNGCQILSDAFSISLAMIMWFSLFTMLI